MTQLNTDCEESQVQVPANTTPIAMSLPAAAGVLGLSYTTVQRLARNGELDTFHVGRTHRVTTESIRAYVARRLAAAKGARG
jgi:excisionase family DNA binding protein